MREPGLYRAAFFTDEDPADLAHPVPASRVTAEARTCWLPSGEHGVLEVCGRHGDTRIGGTATAEEYLGQLCSVEPA